MTETRTDNGRNNEQPSVVDSPLKKLVKGYVKWGLITDLVLSIIATVVQTTMLDALAGLADYDGIGYWIMLILSSILTFIINFFIGIAALIVIAGGLFVVTMLYVFFSPPKPKSEPVQSSDETPKTSS